MANLDTSIAKIRTEPKASVMRSLLADILENINDTTQGIDETLDNLVLEASNNIAENVQARVDTVNNITYATMQKRLDAMAKIIVNLTTTIDDMPLKMYKINDIKLTLDNVNPGTYLGGTWIQVSKGQFIAGVGEGTDTNGIKHTINAGANDGEYEHKIDMDELPAHTTKIEADGYGLMNGTVGFCNRVLVEAAENGNSITNLAPNFGVYVWKRIA